MGNGPQAALRKLSLYLACLHVQPPHRHAGQTSACKGHCEKAALVASVEAGGQRLGVDWKTPPVSGGRGLAPFPAVGDR